MTQPYQRILFATDQSENNVTALERTAEYANKNNIQLDILYVLDPAIAGFGNTQIELSSESLYHLEEKSIGQLEIIKRRLIISGSSIYQVHVHLRIGDPRIIVAQEFPTEYQNDLIVLSSSRKNHLQRFFTGSVSSYVIKNAQADVVVMH
ncbi:MAG: universal stress protein [Liquorilactobacillus nagelii]|jgi:nucleotide-binding universal stress UspA family protein|uniref:universal stress protein n=1 Tax=Liquorilactobacillus nagelii TaxID=82688 RepID=UPI00242AAB31|nr:universal stress protein [Liquorilactobacillus nagelii]MCI1634350.1 universal stress protein [Liquorilactobacillus nagelii]MCI1922248.1 universal stress protein [Liquorilactobacillus nagelii]MCI1977375.1 universal stress protein [Liquorilactobacillus nagelii]